LVSYNSQKRQRGKLNATIYMKKATLNAFGKAKLHLYELGEENSCFLRAHSKITERDRNHVS
jgi:hypothetical protein